MTFGTAGAGRVSATSTGATRPAIIGPPSASSLPAGGDLGAHLETHRAELTRYTNRILGSALEAEDAVQETFIRAWRSFGTFEGRSSLRSWLYRIATNVSLDMRVASQRPPRSIGISPAVTAGMTLASAPADAPWDDAVPDDRAMPSGGGGDPAEIAIARESIRQALVAALQHLPPRQRAVLLLREVLRWKAAEVAELLDTTAASVNSALQRARATLAARDLVEADHPPANLDAERRALLDRYVAAFEQSDVNALTRLLNDEAR
jgi:RNA polymerase sigma-70 factor (ECF subfamily)